MSYMALYRKWRPDEFQEVKGQEHIVTTLKNQIMHERIAHAYLFCGTRGTGKTTIAKLMAKAVNCERPVEGSPCNECASCMAIASGSSVNVIEIDAASNNGVDYIRQINNSVQYSPASGKYVVYIIDEVHMLTSGAYNALLKTLEEPPEYVIFILATTELHKIPVTILSRCQRYDFKRISIEVISERLAEVLDRENISATKEALDYIARVADGSLRDALSILDQCISFNLGEELTYDKVLYTVGAVDIDVYVELMNAILQDDVTTAIEVIDKAIWSGRDLTQLLSDFVIFMRNILLLKLSSNMTIDMSSKNKERLIELGRDISEGYLINHINVIQESISGMSRTTNKKIMAELAIIKLCKPQMQEGYEPLVKRIEELENKLEKGMISGNNHPSEMGTNMNSAANEQANQKNMTKEELSKRINENIEKKFKPADREVLKQIDKLWEEIIKGTSPLAASYLTRKKIELVPEESIHTMTINVIETDNNKTAIDCLKSENIIKELEEYVKQTMNTTITFKLRVLTPKQAKEDKISEYNILGIRFANIEIKE